MSYPSLSPAVAQAPDPEKVTAAGSELLEARRCLLRAAHHLDDSPTRELNTEVHDLRDNLDYLMVKLAERGVS